jgi:hypothetical protein
VCELTSAGHFYVRNNSRFVCVVIIFSLVAKLKLDDCTRAACLSGRIMRDFASTCIFVLFAIIQATGGLCGTYISWKFVRT